MRAYQLESYDGPDGLVLHDVEEPTCGPDEVILAVEAVGINFPDLLLTRGEYQLKPDLPIVPGCEIAGTVAVAPRGSGWAVGDRAAAFIWHGGYAERARVPCSALAPVPDDVGSAVAAAGLVNYHTVLFGLERRGQVAAGDDVLVLGAGGGIGTAAIQVANGLGARTIAGVADERQVETARAAGARETLVLSEGFATQVRDVTAGTGVDVVLDPLGDWLFDEAVRALAPEGRILVVGFAAGRVPSVKVNRLLLRNVAAVGVAFGAFLNYDQRLLARQAETLERMRRDGHVAPRIGARFTFGEIPAALDQLQQGRIAGKAVVEL